MSMHTRIRPTVLEKLIKYYPETGEFEWLHRPRTRFPSDRAFNMWNSRHAGRRFNGENRSNKNRRFMITIFAKQYEAARVALALTTGSWPEEVVDHIDGNPLNNRLDNLRPVSQQENCKNTKRFCTNTSGVTGVARAKAGNWRAYITVNYKQVNLGHYSSISGAIKARQAAEAKYGFHENHGRAA